MNQSVHIPQANQLPLVQNKQLQGVQKGAKNSQKLTDIGSNPEHTQQQSFPFNDNNSPIDII